MAKFNTNFSRSIYGMLLVLIVLGIYVTTVESAFPYPKTYKTYGDGKEFSTMEGTRAGLPGRSTSADYAPSLTESDSFASYRIDNMIRQHSLIGKTFTYDVSNIDTAAMTAGDISDDPYVEWANVTRTYFGSYVEKLATEDGKCKEFVIGVTAEEKPAIILAPLDLKATAYLKTMNMLEGKITVCYTALDKLSNTDTMVWVIPLRDQKLVYSAEGAGDVKDVGTSNYGFDYTVGHITTKIKGGCAVVPFGLENPFLFVPITFVTIETDQDYTVWVQDASTSGFLVCFKPANMADTSTNDIIIHYTATTKFEVKTGSDSRVCEVSFVYDVEKNKVVDILKQLIDTGNSFASASMYDSHVNFFVLESYTSDNPDCNTAGSYSLNEEFYNENLISMPYDEYKAALDDNNVDVHMKLFTLAESQKYDPEVNLGFNMAMTSYAPCEPVGYKQIDGQAGWNSEYQGVCEGIHGTPMDSSSRSSLTELSEYVIPIPATANDYSTLLLFYDEADATATELSLVAINDGDIVVTGAGFKVSRVPMSWFLLFLVSIFIVTL